MQKGAGRLLGFAFERLYLQKERKEVGVNTKRRKKITKDRQEDEHSRVAQQVLHYQDK